MAPQTVEHLPVELWLKILTHVHTPQSKLNLAHTCQFFRNQAIRAASLPATITYLSSHTHLQKTLTLTPPSSHLSFHGTCNITVEFSPSCHIHRRFNINDPTQPVCTAVGYISYYENELLPMLREEWTYY
ncbi:hypothetical protein HDV00_010631 [Rhizophlyctis rosea]|nr:hypothetical protein HDV00_010631 [Rhizophlyctis rosea]